MTRSILLAALLLVACSKSSSPAEAPSAADGGTPAAAVAPGKPIAAFEGVIAHTGEPRTKDALLGHPTVVWFFPFAGTPG